MPSTPIPILGHSNTCSSLEASKPSSPRKGSNVSATTGFQVVKRVNFLAFVTDVGVSGHVNTPYPIIPSVIYPRPRLFTGRASSECVITSCVLHVWLLLHYSKVQGAFLFGWLMFNSRSIMNLQALITTPLPSRFLAILYLWPLLCLGMCNCLTSFWMHFTSLAGFYSIFLICPDCYSSQFPVCIFCFCCFTNLTSHEFSSSSFFLDCTVLLPSDTAPKLSGHSALGILHPHCQLHSLPPWLFLTFWVSAPDIGGF